MNWSLSTPSLLAAATAVLFVVQVAPEDLEGSLLDSDGLDSDGLEFGPNCSPAPLSPGSIRLARARLCDGQAALQQFVREQNASCSENPRDAEQWRLMAETYLERARVRTADKGLRVGEPVLTELPVEMVNEIAAGLAAVEQTRELGAEGADLLRIEAELLSAQITGFGSAISLSGKISELTRKAMILEPGHPRLQVTLGCRKLFAPEFLGHDPRAAKAHFLAAAACLKLDERPLLLAAMACHLLGELDQAEDLLAKAADRNPANRFVAAVLERVAAGEESPFARDLDASR